MCGSVLSVLVRTQFWGIDMAGNHVTFVPNMPAFDSVRRLPGVRAELKRRAENYAAACNADFVASHAAKGGKWPAKDSKDGYRVGAWEGVTRHRASVITATQHAINDNLADKTMLRNLGVLYL